MGSRVGSRMGSSGLGVQATGRGGVCVQDRPKAFFFFFV